MSLPGSRDFDAVDGGPLPAATVNNIQDTIVAHSHGAIEKWFDLNASRQSGMTLGPDVFWYEFDALDATDRIRMVLPLRPGDRLLEWTIYIRDEDAPVDRIEAQIHETDDLPPEQWLPITLIGAAQISSGAGPLDIQAIGEDITLTPHVVLGNRAVEVQIKPDPTGALSAGNTLLVMPTIKLRWDHP